jgi:hypothetical protein
MAVSMRSIVFLSIVTDPDTAQKNRAGLAGTVAKNIETHFIFANIITVCFPLVNNISI